MMQNSTNLNFTPTKCTNFKLNIFEKFAIFENFQNWTYFHEVHSEAIEIKLLQYRNQFTWK